MNVDNDNTEGFESLGRMLETLRTLPRALTVEAAPEIADALREHVVKTIDAGTTPDGVPWKPTEKGTQPLRDAARNVFAFAIGSYVYIRVTGIEARHHLGTVKGRVKRQIIFEGTKLPPPLIAEIKRIMAKRYAAHMSDGAAR
jgi:hypothetical protein